MLALITLFSYIFFEKLRKLFIKITQIIDFNSIKKEEYIAFIKEQEDLINGSKQKKFVILKWILYILSTIGVIWWVFFYAWLDITFPHICWRFFDFKLNYILTSAYLLLILGLVITPLLWRLLASLYVINKFIKNLEGNIQLLPLASDGICGMKPLADTALSFHIVIFLPTIHFLLSFFMWGITGGVKIGFVYFPVLIVVFFSSLYPAHKVMLTQKLEKLSLISSEYKRLIDRLGSSTKSIDINTDIDILDKMDKVSSYFRDIEKMPIWPFDLTILSKFLTTILVPLLLFSIQLLLVYK